MLRSSDRAMLQVLLGLLVLTSVGSAMDSDSSGHSSSSDEDKHSPDPEEWSGSDMSYDETNSWPGSSLRSISNNTGGSDPSRFFDWDPSEPGPLPPVPEICDRLLNAPVPVPVQEVPFFCICSYCKGTVGSKGDRGDRGPPGEAGSPGRRGMTGFKGLRGFTGRQGIKGQKGDLGEKGQPGMVGFTGTKGERGFKGEKGDQGSMGPPGGQGPQGETGTCPASCDSVPGPQGPQGAPGPAGGRGIPGVQGPVGTKGMKGDKGDLGIPGDPGTNGQKGDQGEQGVCECTDGADGADGSQGQKGDKGDKGDTGAQGVQGDTGLQGNKGDMGLMGIPGPCSPAIQSAFCATLNQSFPIHNWPIPFPNVLTNEQGHYDPAMSIYTAPVNGTYVFSFHAATASKPLKVGLFRDFIPIAKITETASQATTSHTVVLHLAAGSMVWLQVKDSETNGMFTDSESTSTFCGYLLYPDFCEIPFGRTIIPPGDMDRMTFSWN